MPKRATRQEANLGQEGRITKKKERKLKRRVAGEIPKSRGDSYTKAIAIPIPIPIPSEEEEQGKDGEKSSPVRFGYGGKRDAKEMIEKEVNVKKQNNEKNHGKLGLSSEKMGDESVPNSQMLCSKTLFMGHLSHFADCKAVEDFFKGYGEILDVCFALHADGYNIGFGYVEFATVEAAQKAYEEKNGAKMLCLATSLEFAVKLGEHVHHKPDVIEKEASKKKKTEIKTEKKKKNENKTTDEKKRIEAKTEKIDELVNCAKFGLSGTFTPVPEGYGALFMRNLACTVDKEALYDFFKDCGAIVDVQMALHSVGLFKGFGYVVFETLEATEKALAEKNGQELLGHVVTLYYAGDW